MASLYRHKIHGYQVRFRLFLPGESLVRYRYARSKDLASELLRVAEVLEIGTRRGDINPRELAQARNLGLLSDDDVQKLSGGNLRLRYDLDMVLSRWETSSSVQNTPYGHTVNLRRVKRMRIWFEAHPIPGLTTSDVKRYLHDRREGLLVFQHQLTKYQPTHVSAKTLMNELQLMRAIIDEAVQLGMVKQNVAREVDWTVHTKKFRRAMSEEELVRVVEAAKANRHLCHGYAYEMVMVALYAGLRRGEIRTLRWCDVDLEVGKILIQEKAVPGETNFVPKGGRAGVATIPKRLAEILGGMDRKGAWVFGGEKPIVGHRFYRTFKVLIERAGLDPSLSLHHARHTYGSWLLRETGDLSYVQSEMRHADITTTRNYLHTVNGNAPARDLDFFRSSDDGHKDS